jgi:SAM-dependent methyltransferase
MERIPEPELMDDHEQAVAYATADFSVPHQRFVDLLRGRFPDLPEHGVALDLGCGSADVSCRFAKSYPGWRVHGLDAAEAMLELGREAVRAAGLETRIALHRGYLPGAAAPLEHYDLVFSNSLLHHLAEPSALWNSACQWSRPGGPVFVMDLLRPTSAAEVVRLVREHASGAPEILQRDFRASLHAAYLTQEVRAQLAAAGLGLFEVSEVSDRHWITWGRR